MDGGFRGNEAKHLLDSRRGRKVGNCQQARAAGVNVGLWVRVYSPDARKG